MAGKDNVIDHFGSGIIEISAVATIIGAPVVEALTLGLKSSAGLPWASMSSFGLLHVAKASLSAAVPDWVRDSLGLRNDNVDTALGQCLPLCKNKQMRNRVDLGDMKAIVVSHTLPEPVRKQNTYQNVSIGTSEVPLCVYRLDRCSTLVLDTVLESETAQGIPIHEFMVDPAGQHKAWKDTVVLSLSLGKLIEVIVLRLSGANLLCYFTALPWAYGFLCGSLLALASHCRDRYTLQAQTDIIAGQLPSPLHRGGSGNVIIGMPRNCRRSLAWKLTWWFYWPIALAGILSTFIVLGRNEAIVIYLWMGFQTTWLLARTFVFYLVENAAGIRHALIVSRQWETSTIALQQRTLHLLLILSQQQAALHPRGVVQYEHDVTDQNVILKHLEDSGWTLSEFVAVDNVSTIASMRIIDVVGDNVLRTCSWFKGKNLNNNDMYDSALVFLKVSGRCLAVPSVRACLCRCKRKDSAQKEWPRGDSHGQGCKWMRWIMWIPLQCAENASITWLEAEGPQTRGDLDIRCLSTDLLDKGLAGGDYLLSFKGVGELDPVLKVSYLASQILMSMMLSIRSVHRSKTSEKV